MSNTAGRVEGEVFPMIAHTAVAGVSGHGNRAVRVGPFGMYAHGGNLLGGHGFV